MQRTERRVDGRAVRGPCAVRHGPGRRRQGAVRGHVGCSPAAPPPARDTCDVVACSLRAVARAGRAGYRAATVVRSPFRAFYTVLESRVEFPRDTHRHSSTRARAINEYAGAERERLRNRRNDEPHTGRLALTRVWCAAASRMQERTAITPMPLLCRYHAAAPALIKVHLSAGPLACAGEAPRRGDS